MLALTERMNERRPPAGQPLWTDTTLMRCLISMPFIFIQERLTGVGALDDTEVFEVTPGHLFVMGDNRDDSADGQVSPQAGGVGLVPMEPGGPGSRGCWGPWDLGVARKSDLELALGLPAVALARVLRLFSRVN
jgi:hypothetical protein